MFVGRCEEYCTCGRQLFVFGFIILIYPALLQLEKKFMKNSNKYYENRHFHGTDTEKKDTLKVLRELKECKHRTAKNMWEIAHVTKDVGLLSTRIVLCDL